MKNLLKRLFWEFFPKPVHKIRLGIGRGLLMYADPYETSQRILGFYEKEIAPYFIEFARKCDYFFDIGAADGYYSLIYRKYNKQGKVFVCEGNPEYSKLQKVNFALNNIELDNSLFLTHKFIRDKIGNNNIKIDDLIIGENKNYFFKIDVDGEELSVLKSAINQIKNNQCYFIIETHSLTLERDCINFLKNLHYESKIVKNAFYRIVLPELRPTEHNRWFIARREALHFT